MIPLQRYMLIHFSMLLLLGFQIAALLFINRCEYPFTCLSITVRTIPFLLEVYNSMFSQLYIDLAITLSETLFSTFLVSSLP